LCPSLGPSSPTLRASDLFGDTIDFDHSKRHYYEVHRRINPTGIVPTAPDLSGWLTPHGREALGGRPFGDGTPARPAGAGRGRARRPHPIPELTHVPR
jgi:putative glutathione S-transferase